MLANGATLQVKVGNTWKDLPGLKELPEMGVDPEKVENTCLTDSVKQYENGIGDPGDMTYKFKFVNGADTDAWRILKPLEAAKSTNEYKETLFDGTTTTFEAQVALKRSGGGVNAAMEFDAAMSLQSDLTITPPAAQSGN